MQLRSNPTAQQQQILVLLSQGKTINAAAEAVGIHRNTIANWRRSSESFRGHWHNMQYEQAMHWRDEMQSLAQIAVEAVLRTLTDEKTPPSVRLRAALAVLNKVTEVAPAQPGLQAQAPSDMHKPAQPPEPDRTEPQEPILPEPLPFPNPFDDEVFELDVSAAPAPHAPTAEHAQSAQACTTSFTDLHEDLRHLDDEGLADLLDHMCMPPSFAHGPLAMHNRAQSTAPGGTQSGSSRPGSRDSS